ncbi:putative DNA repair protein ruvB [Pseudomonas syringae pv. actinidiae ICMP 19079]|nr:putative DNA repair protein ruvB [Pseudomonas syringae pv. actinidiae ICMP 19079]
MGHTKTLAKAAQHASKLYKERTGGVVDLRADHAVEWLLKRMPTQEVWGVGRRISVRLEADGVTTAWQLANTDPILLPEPNRMVCLPHTKAWSVIKRC